MSQTFVNNTDQVHVVVMLVTRVYCMVYLIALVSNMRKERRERERAA